MGTFLPKWPSLKNPSWTKADSYTSPPQFQHVCISVSNAVRDYISLPFLNTIKPTFDLTPCMLALGPWGACTQRARLARTVSIDAWADCAPEYRFVHQSAAIIRCFIKSQWCPDAVQFQLWSCSQVFHSLFKDGKVKNVNTDWWWLNVLLQKPPLTSSPQWFTSLWTF